jgi:hypothetical protein
VSVTGAPNAVGFAEETRVTVVAQSSAAARVISANNIRNDQIKRFIEYFLDITGLHLTAFFHLTVFGVCVSVLQRLLRDLTGEQKGHSIFPEPARKRAHSKRFSPSDRHRKGHGLPRNNIGALSVERGLIGLNNPFSFDDRGS